MLKNSRFTEIDEEFICENCGRKVSKLGYSCRNHCPYCLHSKHVDKNPGDRAEECHGDLEPVSLEIDGKKGYIIIFKCKKCGDIIESTSVHDFKTCSCGACSVDGGHDYLRRCAESLDDFIDLSEFDSEDEKRI